MALPALPPPPLQDQLREAAYIVTLPADHPALRDPMASMVVSLPKTEAVSAQKAQQAEADFFTPDLKKIIAAATQNAFFQRDGKGHLTNKPKNPQAINHECYASVGDALRDGGLPLPHIASNKGHPDMYEDALQSIGFEPLPFNEFQELKAGDAYVIKPTGKHSNGHIAIFNGKNFVSGFVQKGANIYHNVPFDAQHFTLFRHPQLATQAAQLGSQIESVIQSAEATAISFGHHRFKDDSAKNHAVATHHRPAGRRIFASIQLHHSPRG